LILATADWSPLRRALTSAIVWIGHDSSKASDHAPPS
jgi:hypothetical protein